MNTYACDTDIISLFLRGDVKTRERVAALGAQDLVTTIVTVEEILSGWYAQIRRAKNDEKLERAYKALQDAVEFMSRIRILPFSRDLLEEWT